MRTIFLLEDLGHLSSLGSDCFVVVSCKRWMYSVISQYNRPPTAKRGGDNRYGSGKTIICLSHMITILHCSIITPFKIFALSLPQAEALPLGQFCLQLLDGLFEIAPQIG